MFYGFLIIAFLSIISAFFAFSEISLAASRRMKLRPLAEAGDERAARILSFQEQPGLFFTTVQIGLNSMAMPFCPHPFMGCCPISFPRP